jgi:alkanesulfonate monooxygenase SsuD/methylene tetrahydromethanopterin reductase-like flavin-dependent oxidoreductase (luciferase family)
VRISVWPNLQQPWDDVLATVRHADTSGWDGAYVADHFMGDGGAFGPADVPTFESTAAVAALLASTDRLRIGPLVLGASYRHPAVVAKWAVTVDHASGGRLILGLGAGWQQNEHDQYGIELPPVRDRVDRFEEYCAVVTALLREQRATFTGRWYQVRKALCEPPPVQQPLPLLVGAKGDRMLGIAARYADVWNMWASPETFVERSGALDRRCEAIDRDPASIQRSTQALFRLTDDRAHAERFVEAVAPRPAVAGPPEQITDAVGRWHDAGVDELIVPDFALRRGSAKLDELDRLLAAMEPFRTTTPG